MFHKKAYIVTTVRVTVVQQANAIKHDLKMQENALVRASWPINLGKD